MSETVKQVLAAMLQVQQAVHAVGIGKLRQNTEQRFNFRGIDDALMAFAPLLDSAGLVVIPSYANLSVTTRQTKSGGNTYNASVEGTFTFVAVADGSSLTVGPFFGEANDGQDKGISKATSIAYRNCLFLTFCVPHEPAIGGDPDGLDGDDGGGFDITRWADAIGNASDMAELNKIGADLKSKAKTIPPAAMRNIRALWSKKSKEFK